MSDNKKYYYLKLKADYFERDNVKILESMENGYIYSNIIMKLYLKSLKHDGQLMMTDRIPYDPDKIDILAKVLNHDIDHVKGAIKLGKELDIVEIFDTGQMFMKDIQNFIGHSSTEADRIREYRKKLDTGVQMYDKSTPERKKEKEEKKEPEKKKDKKTEAEASLPYDKDKHNFLVKLFYDKYQELHQEKLDFNNNKHKKEMGCIKNLNIYSLDDINKKAIILEDKCRDPRDNFHRFLPSMMLSQWLKLVGKPEPKRIHKDI
jgi:predicted phage replisome organizer